MVASDVFVAAIQFMICKESHVASQIQRSGRCCATTYPKTANFCMHCGRLLRSGAWRHLMMISFGRMLF